MVKMSRERVEKLARELVSAMTRSRSVTFHKDIDNVRQAVSHTLAEEFRREEEREESVRRRLSSVRKPARGTPEWEELFHRMMEEEYVREGLDS